MIRIPGYSDDMMYEKCKLTYDIVFSTTDVKQGRGKKSIVIKKRKYSFPSYVEKETIDNLNYYTDRMKKKSKITLRDYQQKIVIAGAEVLIVNNFLYLTMEVRTGKTLTSMSISQLLNCKKVLFVTKKKAISSIESDYDMLYPDFSITVINYESLHKVEDTSSYDMLILDEAHSMGAFPKPSNRAKQVKEIAKHNPYIILLSGNKKQPFSCVLKLL